MRRPSQLIATLMVFGLAACSSGQPRPFGKAETDSINQLIGDFIAAYNAKDAAKVSSLFTDVGAVMPPNASTRRGTESVRLYYVERFRQGASDLVLEPQTIAGSGPLAFASGDYRLNMAPPDGPARRDRGKFIFILRNQNRRWLLDQLMFSSDFAPGGPTTS
jgi:uncharacterized protein (TIGR02246 family)